MIIKNIVRKWPINRDLLWLDALKPLWLELQEKNLYPLRFAIVATTENDCILELTVVEINPEQKWFSRLNINSLLSSTPRTHTPLEKFGIVQIIPTGINCSFGGYAGDATPVTNLLSNCCDFVLTHPNAVNASDINELSKNTLYIEGKTLDEFMLAEIGLERHISPNRIGTIIDPTGSHLLDRVIHVLNAGMAVGGFNCDTYTIPSIDFGVKIEWTSTGCASGTITNPEVLLETAEALLNQRIDALGVVSVIHGVTKEMCEKHIAGKIPNPSGAVEAIITHLLSKIFRVPTAHAPLPYYQDVKYQSIENPRSSAEFISTPHYFCVLKGLHNAPLILDIKDARAETITINDIGAVVVPASALGGIPVLAAQLHNIPVIAVKENQTILNVNQTIMQLPNLIEVESYLEAAGLITAMRNGMNPFSLKRPIFRAKEVKFYSEQLKTEL